MPYFKPFVQACTKSDLELLKFRFYINNVNPSRVNFIKNNIINIIIIIDACSCNFTDIAVNKPAS